MTDASDSLTTEEREARAVTKATSFGLRHGMPTGMGSTTLRHALSACRMHVLRAVPSRHSLKFDQALRNRRRHRPESRRYRYWTHVIDNLNARWCARRRQCFAQVRQELTHLTVTGRFPARDPNPNTEPVGSEEHKLPAFDYAALEARCLSEFRVECDASPTQSDTEQQRMFEAAGAVHTTRETQVRVIAASAVVVMLRTSVTLEQHTALAQVLRGKSHVRTVLDGRLVYCLPGACPELTEYLGANRIPYATVINE